MGWSGSIRRYAKQAVAKAPMLKRKNPDAMCMTPSTLQSDWLGPRRQCTRMYLFGRESEAYSWYPSAKARTAARSGK